MDIYTTDAVRQMDKSAIEKGIDSILLMENAAFSVVESIINIFDSVDEKKILVCSGKGNNGGDGFATARMLKNRGAHVKVVLLGREEECQSADTLKNIALAKLTDIPIISFHQISDLEFEYLVKNADILIDCIFGTGLSKPIEGKIKNYIKLINQFSKFTLSADIPSGIHSDSGKVLGEAVRANVTVTFQVMKPGLILFPGYEYASNVQVSPIGIPDSLIAQIPCAMKSITGYELPFMIPERKKRTNKGDYGKVYCLCGSDDMPGALVLSASAAYKMGSGLVYGCSTRAGVTCLWGHLPEAVGITLDSKDGVLTAEGLQELDIQGSGAACVLGPGLSKNEHTASFVREAIKRFDVPFILDADALNIIADEIEILKGLKSPSVITPHPKEMSRLTGLPVEAILEDPVNVALSFANLHNVTVVLKDNRTIIASPSGLVYVNTTGNPAMAKGGCGDVLSGVIAAFIAQGFSVLKAAAIGVFIHGIAGDMAQSNLSDYGVLASDIIDNLPAAMQ